MAECFRIMKAGRTEKDVASGHSVVKSNYLNVWGVNR